MTDTDTQTMRAAWGAHPATFDPTDARAQAWRIFEMSGEIPDGRSVALAMEENDEPGASARPTPDERDRAAREAPHICELVEKLRASGDALAARAADEIVRERIVGECARRNARRAEIRAHTDEHIAHWGEPCPEHHPLCAGCAAHAMHRAIVRAAILSGRPLRAVTQRDVDAYRASVTLSSATGHPETDAAAALALADVIRTNTARRTSRRG